LNQVIAIFNETQAIRNRENETRLAGRLSSLDPFNPWAEGEESSLELSDGSRFSWKPSEIVDPEEMDRRIALLSKNVPKIIAANSVEDMENKIGLVSPLWSPMNITPKREIENRDTNLFFAIIGQVFSPLRKFSSYMRSNGNMLPKDDAEREARKMRFFIQRIANQALNHESNKPPSKDSLRTIVELDFTPWARLYPMQHIPEEIGLFTNLRTLNYSGHDITTLHHSICNLESLEILDLEDTKLTTLPLSLSKLSHLKMIKLRGTPIPAETRLRIANAFINTGNDFAALSLLNPINATQPSKHEPQGNVAELFKQVKAETPLSEDRDSQLASRVLNVVQSIPNKSEKIAFVKMWQDHMIF
jgi:hypothetical protein